MAARGHQPFHYARLDSFSLPKDGIVQIRTGDVNVSVTTALSASSPRAVESFDGMKVTEIDRNELERTLLRGVRR
ncbi:MAG: hypothetical protein ACKOYJ_08345, partial [Planctomycetia bacterium]